MYEILFRPLLSKEKFYILPDDSVSGQARPLLDCADAQADLGLCCPHMLEDTFSHGAAHIILKKKDRR